MHAEILVMTRLLTLKDVSATFRGILGARGSVRVYSMCRDNSTAIYTTRFVTQSQPSFYQAGSRRQLSSSSTLTNKDRNDGEFFTATPAFDSEYSSSGVDASVTDVLAQTEDFAALGLGGYSPSGLVQSLLEFLHVNAHLPWWASIVAATIAARLLLFPLVVRMRRDVTKMVNVHSAKITNLRTTASKMVAYRRIGNKLAEAREAAKLPSIYHQHRVNPLPPPALYIVLPPTFISFFVGIQGMANLPLESMKTGGLYWFTDLTVPDPTYTFPLMALLTFLLNTEVNLLDD